MSKLIVMCGIPASGKSTLAEKLAEKENAIIVSADAMREELHGDISNQDNHADIFEKVHERIKGLLSEGKNVVMDSTNINRKRRIHLINNEFKADEYVVYYMNTPIENCLRNDWNRDRKVGVEAINKMYKNLHIPTKLEGWDEVIFVNQESKESNTELREKFEKLIDSDLSHDKLLVELVQLIPEFHSIYDVPHDSTYHSFSISRHTYYIFKHIQENKDSYKGSHYKELLVASLFHDVGKGICKSFYNYKGEEKRYASYIGHENCSAQIAIVHLTIMGYSDDFIKYVADLIQFHMMPMDMSAKTEKRLKKLLTEEQLEDLMFLHKADKQAK